LHAERRGHLPRIRRTALKIRPVCPLSRLYPFSDQGTTARFTQNVDFPIGIPRHDIERLAKLWGTGALRDIFFPSISRGQIDDNTYKAMEQLIGSRDIVKQAIEALVEIDVRPRLCSGIYRCCPYR